MNRANYIYRVRRRDRGGVDWKAARYYTRAPAALRRAVRWEGLGYVVEITRSETRVRWQSVPLREVGSA